MDKENNSINNNDYKYEIKDKKNIFSNFIEKIKSHKNQKLLTSGNSKSNHITNRSINSLWNLASIRSTVLQKLDKISNSIINREKVETRNGFKTEIIGKTNEGNKSNENSKLDAKIKNPIIPNINEFSNNITTKDNPNFQLNTNNINHNLNNENRKETSSSNLRVENIDTSALTSSQKNRSKTNKKDNSNNKLER